MLTSTYHAITTNHPSSCRMHCHDEGDRPPATWEHRWRTETMPASAFEYLCEACASELRRREVDRELREISARVIHIPTFEAWADAVESDGSFFDLETFETTRARLARLALGEG